MSTSIIFGDIGKQCLDGGMKRVKLGFDTLFHLSLLLLNSFNFLVLSCKLIIDLSLDSSRLLCARFLVVITRLILFVLEEIADALHALLVLFLNLIHHLLLHLIHFSLEL